MSKSNNSNPCSHILEYLKSQNRPYSAIDIFNNLHKEHGKTAIVRALELLASENKIIEKTYGKQKIYFINQNEFSESDNTDLHKLDAEINNLSHTVSFLQQQIKSAEGVLSNLNKSISTEAAEAEITKLKEELPHLKSKLADLEANKHKIGPEVKDKLYTTRAASCKEWQKRKRIVNEMMDAILEGYPKNKKAFIEEVGIETDGELKVFNF